MICFSSPNRPPQFANGPPWISSMNGYFRDGSNPGGLMIQPCIFRPSFDELYEISSTWPSDRPESRSVLSDVSVRAVAPAAPAVTATCDGTVGVLSVNATVPSRATEKLPPLYALDPEPRLPTTVRNVPSSAKSPTLVLPRSSYCT